MLYSSRSIIVNILLKCDNESFTDIKQNYVHLLKNITHYRKERKTKSPPHIKFTDSYLFLSRECQLPKNTDPYYSA